MKKIQMIILVMALLVGSVAGYQAPDIKAAGEYWGNTESLQVVVGATGSLKPTDEMIAQYEIARTE